MTPVNYNVLIGDILKISIEGEKRQVINIKETLEIETHHFAPTRVIIQGRMSNACEKVRWKVVRRNVDIISKSQIIYEV